MASEVYHALPASSVGSAATEQMNTRIETLLRQLRDQPDMDEVGDGWTTNTAEAVLETAADSSPAVAEAPNRPVIQRHRTNAIRQGAQMHASFDRVVHDLSRKLERYTLVDRVLGAGNARLVYAKDTSGHSVCSASNLNLASADNPWRAALGGYPESSLAGGAHGGASGGVGGSVTALNSYDGDSASPGRNNMASGEGSSGKKSYGIAIITSTPESIVGRKPNRVIAKELAQRIELLQTNAVEYEIFYTRIAKYREEAKNAEHLRGILHRNKQAAGQSTPEARRLHRQKISKEHAAHVLHVLQQHEQRLEERRTHTLNQIAAKDSSGSDCRC